jgi:hypothetical protein
MYRVREKYKFFSSNISAIDQRQKKKMKLPQNGISGEKTCAFNQCYKVIYALCLSIQDVR